MTIAELLNDKTVKSKEKTALLARWLLGNKITVNELIAFAEPAKDPAKATCIEAFEYATKQNPEIADAESFEWVVRQLTSKAPRVQWESAKVISNTAHLFTGNLDEAIKYLLQNSEAKGTVVRWSAALALGVIVQLSTKHRKGLLPSIEAICNAEEQNSIRKIYLSAIKKVTAG